MFDYLKSQKSQLIPLCCVLCFALTCAHLGLNDPKHGAILLVITVLLSVVAALAVTSLVREYPKYTHIKRLTNSNLSTQHKVYLATQARQGVNRFVSHV